ncbi:MAG: hypothetical protein NVS3B3_02770 [Aquirhabdus sp.]
MNIELIRHFLGWCTVINYAVLFVWFLAYVFAHEWMRQIHGRWFRMTNEHFDMIHYSGMALYKVGILLLNLVPYLALTIALK